MATKNNYRIAANFNHRQRKQVLIYNGFFFVRMGDGDHEIWRNNKGVQISVIVNDKGCTFCDLSRKLKLDFYDKKGKPIY